MSSAVCSSESGESASVVAFSLPPPQPGRRSRSSGRAVATTSSGTSVTQSTSSSRKSRRLSSAQWMSSTTTTSGRCSASPSRKRRQAANASFRRSPPSCASLGEAEEREEMRLDPRLVAGAGERVLDGLVDLRRDLLRCVLLEDAGLRLDDLAERPQRDSVAVGEAAPLAPGDELGVGVDDALELVDEAALADPRDADEREELRRALVARPLERVPDDAELALAADELRARLVRDVDAEARVRRDGRPDADRAPPCPSPRPAPRPRSRRRGGSRDRSSRPRGSR